MNEELTIRVRYFALLRELAGREEDLVRWGGEPPTLAAFREHLAAGGGPVGDLLRSRPVLCAVNREYAGPGTILRDGDEVGFFPPVTGG